MPKTITISDNLFSQLESLARPFIDRDPQDVISRLVEKEAASTGSLPPTIPRETTGTRTKVMNRVPRERGAVVELNGETIAADTVPDLCKKVMEYSYSKGLWGKIEELAPYKTSSKRFLFSTSPKHPNGNDFFVPIKYRNLYIETHKNYQTSIDQLSRLLARLGVTLSYRGS